jgi:hypothetical protein
LRLSDIKDTDADYLAMLATVEPSYTIEQLIGFPIGKTALYAEISAGRLIASSWGIRTFITGPNLARWLTLLEREGKQVDRSRIRESRRKRALDWRARKRAAAAEPEAPPKKRGRPRKVAT